MTTPNSERIYPPGDERTAMRKVLSAHLRRHPAQMTASEVVRRVRANGGGEYTERDLTLELSRMLGSSVRMNANRTLSSS